MFVESLHPECCTYSCVCLFVVVVCDGCLVPQEAEEKITKAECERRKMEERYRLRQMCTSVGLQQPVGVTVPGSFVSHRGKGLRHFV